MTEESAMKRAIELASRGVGMVSPNPLVGAVIIKNNKKIGEGWHEKFGGVHAEVNAIQSIADNELEGSTLIVNLEPCTHQGKTPPCADLIIEKKISKVVIGMVDPNPHVSGKGIENLKNAGIEVVVGVLEQESKWLNRYFNKFITTGIPYITLKVAQSLGGKISTSTGKSQWITCKESRKKVHKLRSELDAVLVGKNTALIDNPRLTVRDVEGRDPMRIILDSQLALPFSLNVFKEASRSKTIICCSLGASKSRKANNYKVAGINVLGVKTNETGRIDIQDAITQLAKHFNIVSIFVEGGAEIFSAFLESKAIDELQIFMAPIIIGKGNSSFEKFSIDNIEDAAGFDIHKIERINQDIHITAICK